MNVEIEHQRYGVDLIKIDNEETKIVFTNYGAELCHGNIMTTILY